MNRKISPWLVDAIFFGLLFVVALVASYPLNFPNGEPKGGNEFFADKAAYYVYLPATFIYKWDVTKFPKGIDERTRGFTLHEKSQKVMIKTTYGVALLLSPFFIITHVIAKVFNLQPDGFSIFYQGMMTIPGMVYLIVGLFFLRSFLSYYYTKWISNWVVFLLFIGTNLFFYSVDEGLMSHVYSFFLFSLTLFLLKRYFEQGRSSYTLFLWISLSISLAILIRPTNILLLTLFLFLDSSRWKEVGNRFKYFLQPKLVISFVFILFLVLLPQMLYWHYLSGKFLYNSYPGEGFVNWKNPMIPEVWFSPLNGWFLYTPLAILFVFGMILMIVKGKPNGIYIATLFILISYLFGSWLTWFFGGSLGMRPFIEYYALFSLPFGFTLDWIRKRRNLLIQTLWVVLIFIFCYTNLKFTKHYNFFQGSIWSWDDYKIYLSDAGIHRFDRNSYTYINDFENNTLPDDVPRIFDPVRSKTLSSYLDESMEFGCKYSRRFDQIIQNPLKEATFSLFYSLPKVDTCHALFVCSVEDSVGKVLLYKAFEFAAARNSSSTSGKWSELKGSVHFPEWIPGYARVSFYLWNIRKEKFFIDDIKIQFK